MTGGLSLWGRHLVRLGLTAGYTPGAFGAILQVLWGLTGYTKRPSISLFEEGKLHMAKAMMDTVDANTGIVSNAHSETFGKQIFNNLLVPCMFLSLRC